MALRWRRAEGTSASPAHRALCSGFEEPLCATVVVPVRAPGQLHDELTGQATTQAHRADVLVGGGVVTAVEHAPKGVYLLRGKARVHVLRNRISLPINRISILVVEI